MVYDVTTETCIRLEKCRVVIEGKTFELPDVLLESLDGTAWVVSPLTVPLSPWREQGD